MKQWDLVILMSGGLDSVVAWHYAKKELGIPNARILPLRFDIGQPYAEKEKRSLDILGVPHVTMQMPLIRPEFDNVPGTGFGDQIIPGRNMMFATVAASFAPRVWLMALEGEMHPLAKERDKSAYFFTMMSHALTYVFDVLRPNTVLETPFAEMSKTEVVAWALAHGLTPDYLSMTSTCYHPEHERCGVCSTCVKRWIAMFNNGIVETYNEEPWMSEYATVYRQQLVEADEAKDFSHYSEKRVREGLDAFSRVEAML